MKLPFIVPRPSAKLNEWQAFERRVHILFYDLMQSEFAEKRIIGGYEVDCYSRDELSHYVIECKTQQQLKNNNSKLRDYLTTFSGKKVSISNDIRKTENKRDIVFIICTKGIEISPDNRKIADENGIYIWEESYIENLEGLYKAIGPMIKQYALRELGIKQVIDDGSSEGNYLRIPALSYSSYVEGRRQEQYSLFISARQLLDLGYVFRISNGDPSSYQRVIQTGRLKEIAEYIDEGNTFNSSVVVSFDKNTFFQEGYGDQQAFEYKTGFLKIPKEKSSVRIIDGQHRIYSYLWADEKRIDDKISVLAMTNLNSVDQARIYLEINDHQKPVKKDDLNFLMAKIDPLYTGFLPNIVLGLSEKGVLKNKISTPGNKLKTTKLNLANIVKGLRDRRIFSSYLPMIYHPQELTDPSFEQIEQCQDIIEDFLRRILALSDTVSISWRDGFILTNNGFNTFLYLLALIAQENNGKYNPRIFTGEIENGLLNFFRQYEDQIDVMRASSSEGGRRDNAKKLVYQLNLVDKSFGGKFIKGFEPKTSEIRTKGEYLTAVSDVENGLKRLLKTTLSTANSDWWIRYLTNDMRDRINHEMQNEQESYLDTNPAKREDYLMIGDIAFLIDRNWGLFKTILQSKSGAAYSIEVMKGVRNKLSHGIEVEHLTDDEKQAFEKAINNLKSRLKDS